jgi:hypothetical protein
MTPDLAPRKRTYACVRGKRAKVRKPAPRPCERCQAVFSPKREDPKKPARHCSPKCRAASWRDRQKKDNRLTAIEAALRSFHDMNLAARISALEARVEQHGLGMKP